MDTIQHLSEINTEPILDMPRLFYTLEFWIDVFLGNWLIASSKMREVEVISGLKY